MNNNISITIAQTNKDLVEILNLQVKNHISSVPENCIITNGFLTVRQDLETLSFMSKEVNQVVAKNPEGKVVGYALTMLPSFHNIIPVLVPMFQIFNQVVYKGKLLNEYKYYVMGQICVAEEYRGMGVFDQLYLKHKEIFSEKYDICVTEISVRNLKSISAHKRVGFQIVHTFKDAVEEWNIVVWDWR